MPMRMRIWVLVAYLLISIVLACYYCTVPPSPDQSIFDYMAWLSAHGAPHYAGAFDVTWPGQLVIHDIGLALFGVHPWTARLTDFLYLQLGVAALWGFASGSGHPRAATALIFIYPIIYVTSGGWMAGHRDIIGMHLLIGASALMLVLPRRRLLAGLLSGYAAATRPTYLLYAGWLVLDDLLRVDTTARFRNGAAFAAGVAIVGAGFVAAGLVSGSLSAWYGQAVRFVVDVYPVAASRTLMVPLFFHHVLANWNWLAAAAAIGGGIWLLNSRDTRSLSLFAGLLMTVIVSFIVQNKGFAYHLGGLIPLMTLAACIGMEVAWSNWRRGGGAKLRLVMIAAGATAFLLMSIGLVSRVRHNIVPFIASGMKVDGPVDARSAEHGRIVSIIRAESRSEDYLYQFGWNYDVAFLSERRSPTRYINAPALTLIRAHVMPYAGWLAQFEQDLVRRPPRFIVVERTYWAANRSTPVVASLGRVLKGRYVLRLRGETMDLMEFTAP